MWLCHADWCTPHLTLLLTCIYGGGWVHHVGSTTKIKTVSSKVMSPGFLGKMQLQYFSCSAGDNFVKRNIPFSHLSMFYIHFWKSPEIWCKSYAFFRIISKIANQISDCVQSEKKLLNYFLLQTFARLFPKAWTVASKFPAVVEIVPIFLTKSAVVVARQKFSSHLPTLLFYCGVSSKKKIFPFQV